MSKTTAADIIKQLCKAKYATYIVGGSVRDMLDNKISSDVDIATAATPKQIEKLFKNNCRLITAGTFFKVVIVDGIEVATFRKDKYNGLNDKDVEITKVETIFEDLGRRDITINAMAFCQFTGDIIDPYNGRSDLKQRKVKFVGNAIDRIYEDPNRIVRACRFLATIDGTFDSLTKRALKSKGYLVKSHVTPERIRVEIMKAMQTQHASVFFNALHEIDVLKYIFPSLECCYDFDMHGIHHRESIITHNLLCGDNISCRYPLIKLAGYLHDVGKPRACRFNIKTQDVQFIHHSAEGKDLVKNELKLLTFSNKEIDYISTLIRLHMSNFDSEKSIRKTTKKLNDLDIELKDLYRLKLADSKANIKKGPYPYSSVRNDFKRIKKALEVGNKNRFDKLAISGNDIMKIINLKPGPIIGKIKDILLDIILEYPEVNDENTLEKIINNDKSIKEIIDEHK